MDNKILSREELLEIKKNCVMDSKGAKAMDTALSLYDENAKLKEGIKKLKGRVMEAHNEGIDDGVFLMKEVLDRIEKLREGYKPHPLCVGMTEADKRELKILNRIYKDLADITEAGKAKQPSPKGKGGINEQRR